MPVRVLSRLFRGKLLAYLLEAHDAGRLPMSGGQAHLADPQQFRRFLSPLYQADWVVYAKPPVSGQPETILGYLARYTYRVAISNQRLVSIDHGSITFQYKDYARDNRWQPMTLPADEFLRRLSQHLLPPGFVRVRSFGFLANCHRQRCSRHDATAAVSLLSALRASRVVHGAFSLSAMQRILAVQAQPKSCLEHLAEEAAQQLPDNQQPDTQADGGQPA